MHIKLYIAVEPLSVYSKPYCTLYCMHEINILKPTGHVMHRQFNIQQLYALPTLYLCVFVFI